MPAAIRATDADDFGDDAFLAAFESGTLAEDRFRHRDHVHLGYIYLRRHGFEEALRRMAHGLRRFAAAHGKPERYHRTMTVAFMALIAERMDGADPDDRFAGFAAANPDLFDLALLYRYYPRDLLDAQRARRCFVLPPPRSDAP